MSKFLMYGLCSSLWRKIRLSHSGNVEIVIKDKNNNSLGKGIVSRYDSVIHLSSNISFRDVSIKNLLIDTKDVFIGNLKGDEIPICKNYYL